MQLENGQLAFSICESHGALISAAIGGITCAVESFDTYILTGDDGRSSTEAADMVIESDHRDDGVLKLICRNEELGLVLHKEYSLAPDEPMLRKRITIPPGQFKGYLRVRSGMNPSRDLIARGWFYTPSNSGHHASKVDPAGPVPVAKIRGETRFKSAADTRLVTCFNPALGVGIGHYRAKADDWFVPFVTNGLVIDDSAYHTLRYVPGGWDFEVMLLGEGESGPISCEVHYMPYVGDYVTFLNTYRQLPERTANYSDEPPKWLDELKLVVFTLPNRALEQEVPRLHELAREVGGKVGIALMSWAACGDFPTDRPFLPERVSDIEPLDPEWVRDMIARIQETGDAQVGLYMQGWGFEMLSEAYKAHSEWAMQGRDGKPYFSGFKDRPDGELYIQNLHRPGVKEHLLSGLRRILDYYRPGWMHWDGGGIWDLPEYGVMRASSASDYMDYNLQAKEVTKQFSPECAFLMNYANNPFGEIYYLEVPETFNSPMGDGWDPERGSTAWQSVVDSLFHCKLFQPGGRHIVPLYWEGEGMWESGEFVNLYNFPPEENYIAFTVMFGFTPQMGRWRDIEWVRERKSYIAMAYRLRGSKMIPSSTAVSPCWWRDGISAQAFALKLGNAVLVPVVTFEDDLTSVPVTIDLEQCGLSGDTPVYTWLVRVLDREKCLPMQPIEVTSNAVRYDVGIGKGMSGASMLVTTNCPVFVVGVEGEDLPVYLPGVAEVAIESDGNGNWLVDVRSETARVLVANEWKLTSEGCGEPVTGLSVGDYASAELRRGRWLTYRGTRSDRIFSIFA